MTPFDMNPIYYRAGREYCRRAAPDLFYASHMLGKPERHAGDCIAAVYRQLDGILKNEPCDPSACQDKGCVSSPEADGDAVKGVNASPAGPAGADSGCCGGDSPEARRRVCSSVLEHLYAGLTTGKNEFDGFPAVARAAGLPREHFERACDGMALVAKLRRYATWKRLLTVCQETAGVAALLGLRVIAPDAASGGALEAQALAMGAAMHLSAALPALEADWSNGRLLLPLEDLVRFELTEHDVARFSAARTAGQDPRWQALMAYEVNRVRRLFDGAEAGLNGIQPRARQAVGVLLEIGRGRLDAFEKSGYDPFGPAPPMTWGSRVRQLPRTVRVLARVGAKA